MSGNRRFKLERWIAPAFVLLALGFPSPIQAGQQTNPGAVDIIKPDASAADANKTNPTKPDVTQQAPSQTANQDAPRSGEPTDPKARKTYADALDWDKHKFYDSALQNFLKANKQDGGHCWECLRRAYGLAVKLDAYKDAVDIARQMMPFAQNDRDKASLHFRLGTALQVQGVKEKKEQPFQESSSEFKTALDLDPAMARARYHWGITLAHLNQDDAARAQFSAFLDQDHNNPTLHERAERFLDHIDLACATMAPPFIATTLDGRQISLDSLAGKVVLIDFWATWCGPCREALPRIENIAHKCDGQPLVIVSISLDTDEAKWRSFVDKNRMTWTQVRDGGSNGAVSKKFGVTAIPATFTIDADGVLEDQHVGDANIESKLKKLVAHAAEVNSRKPTPATTDASAGTGS